MKPRADPSLARRALRLLTFVKWMGLGPPLKRARPWPRCASVASRPRRDRRTTAPGRAETTARFLVSAPARNAARAPDRGFGAQQILAGRTGRLCLATVEARQKIAPLLH